MGELIPFPTAQVQPPVTLAAAPDRQSALRYAELHTRTLKRFYRTDPELPGLPLPWHPARTEESRLDATHDSDIPVVVINPEPATLVRLVDMCICYEIAPGSLCVLVGTGTCAELIVKRCPERVAEHVLSLARRDRLRIAT